MGSYKVLVLAGDGIGVEVTAQAVTVLETVCDWAGIGLALERAPFGGASIDDCGVAVATSTLELGRAADAVLRGPVGGPRWDSLPSRLRPERALYKLRETLGVYANLRPVRLFAPLAHASPLRLEGLGPVDLLLVRELLGDVYFGLPRGIWDDCEARKAVNTMVYTENEIRRIGRAAFELARGRKRRLTSLDKANVLEVSALWRDVMSELATDYPDVELRHMYVDNCAMQLLLDPTRFDVITAGNLFGDILAHEGAALAGSIGMLPSASLGNGSSVYEPIHGSAPDIAGTGKANPLGAILSVALMLEHTLHRPDLGRRVEMAIERVLTRGLRTADLMRGAGPTCREVGCAVMGDAVVRELREMP